MKAVCPLCGRSVAVSKLGRLRKHTPVGEPFAPCPSLHVSSLLDVDTTRITNCSVGVSERTYQRLTAAARKHGVSRRALLEQLITSALDKAGAP